MNENINTEGFNNLKYVTSDSVNISNFIYISYCNDDISKLYSDLDIFEKNEYTTFIRNPSLEYSSESIEMLINECTLFVVYISHKSVESYDIRKEIRLASNFNKHIIPIYLDETELKYGLKSEINSSEKIYKYLMEEEIYKTILGNFLKKYLIEETKEDFINSFKNLSEYNQKILYDDTDDYASIKNLIQSSDNYISLEKDIHMFCDERNKFLEGISLDSDNMIIDANNHSISANFINQIFKITAKNITLQNFIFKNSNLENNSILISNDASLTLKSCVFESNTTKTNGIIYNHGKCTLKNCKFTGNISKKEGCCIYNKEGTLNIIDSSFDSNKSCNSGGAINNWAKMNITNSTFNNNFSYGYGGAIANVIDGVLHINNSTFSSNKSGGEGCAIFNENYVEIFSSKFFEHYCNNNIIYNEINLKIIDTTFNDNIVKSCVHNDENAIFNLSSSKFIDNTSSKSTIVNMGKYCSVDIVNFNNNSSSMEYANNIYNKGYLRLKEPRISDEVKNILNKSNIDIWGLNKDIINKYVHNLGDITNMTEKTNPFNFTCLDSLIHNPDLIKGEEKCLSLDNDFILDYSELDFYEGGIILDIDNLIIDGNNHIIDGKKRTRIFVVTGKNITLKNIIFKNGRLLNIFDDHTTGGGVLKILKNSSLKLNNCEFIDNECADDGGAISNSGEIKIYDSNFDNNFSENYGGAINNKNTLKLKNTTLSKNKSRIAGAIFNIKSLYMEDITLNDNISNFPQDIFNHELVEIGDDEKYDELIFNIDNINKQTKRTNKSFTQLVNQIKEYEEITLDSDITFNYKTDKEYINGIVIEKLISLDGNGHSIDCKDTSSLFNTINPNLNITFKNIIFKNAYSSKNSIIENNADITFINCKFIKCHCTTHQSLIHNKNGSVTIKDSTFINNFMKHNPLISNKNILKIDNSKFIINHSNSKMGIITNYDNCKITNSRFLDNTSQKSASILNNQKDSLACILNSCFKNNTSKESGATITNESILIIDESKFISNYSNGDGGAISNKDDAKLEIHKGIFRKNQSGGDAGAIVNWGNIRINDVIFAENSSRKDGGAINIQKGTLSIKNSEFNKNNTNLDGGAILNWGEIKIDNTLFKENYSKEIGGALNSQKGNIIIKNSIFKENKSDGSAGVILHREGQLDLFNNEFYHNSTEGHGGVILNFAEVNIDKSKFKDNMSVEYGGVINNQQRGIVEIIGSTLIGNTAKEGGAIYTMEDENIKISNSNIKNNKPDDIY